MRTATLPKPKKEKRSPIFMRPTPFRLARRKGIVIYDIESKEASPSLIEDSQRMGFERAFLVTIYDGSETLALRNERSANDYPWNLRAISPGGCIDKAMAFLLQPRYATKHCRIYAHNGGKFDHNFLFYWLKLNQDVYRFEVVSVQSKVQRLDIWRVDMPRRKLSWSFVDSISLIPLGLEEAAKTFLKNVELKKSMDLDTPEDSPLWEEYAIQDVRSTYYVVQQFHNLVESLGGEVGLTAPSTSVKLFQRRYLKEPIYRHSHFRKCDGSCRDKACKRKKAGVCDGKCHGCLHGWIFKGYYGGRSEVFARRGRGLFYYDINSSYPRAMLDPMPVGQRMELEAPSLEEVRRYEALGHIGFLECTVQIPDTCKLPPLPMREGHKLIFPTTGEKTRTGVWALAELNLLFEPEVNGRIVSIKRAVFYQAAPVFQHMVNDIYAYREKHRDTCEDEACKGCKEGYDDGMSFVAKLILNSLYGKFGMDSQRDACLYVAPDEKAPDHAIPLNGVWIDDAEKQEKRDVIWVTPYFVDVDYMIPQIAAYITSLARIRLFRGFLYALRIGARLFYSDTDAMVIDKQIPTGSKLGQWKREQDYGKRLDGDFLLPKLYRLSQHDLHCVDVQCKGCAMVYHHPSCPKPKAAKAKDCQFCNRSPSVQHMKGIPGKKQTGEAFAILADENDTLIAEKKGQLPKRRKEDYQKIPIERVMQHRTILRSFGKEVEYTGPKLVRTHKAHRTVYDKRFMLDDGSSIPFRVGEETCED